MRCIFKPLRPHGIAGFFDFPDLTPFSWQRWHAADNLSACLNFDAQWNKAAPPGFEFKGVDPAVCNDVYTTRSAKSQSCCVSFETLTPAMKWRKSYLGSYWQNVRAFVVEVRESPSPAPPPSPFQPHQR
jgi:hypothetical protein